MKYLVTFTARNIGALGIPSQQTYVVNAESEDGAHLKLYDLFEHFGGWHIQSITQTVGDFIADNGFPYPEI